jgi:creatinine amidohydrolase/Fe(II)-dependent formamide hydrolase-like protein
LDLEATRVSLPEHLSYTQLERCLLQPGWRLALLPIGCYEQHGPELPLATDLIQAEELARRLAARLRAERGGQAFVLPAIAYTPTEPNKGYAGTVSVPGDPFRVYFEAVMRGILQSDYSAVVVVNSHGSVEPLLKEVGFKLVLEQFESGHAVRPILVLNVYDAASKASTVFGQKIGRHADWTEFLMTYGLLGDGYYTEERLQRLREFSKQHDFDVRMPAVLGIPAQLRSVSGVQGEPWPASPEPLESLAARYWDLVEDEVYGRLTFELSDFETRFT